MSSIPNCYIKIPNLLEENTSIKTPIILGHRTLVSHEMIVWKCKIKILNHILFAFSFLLQDFFDFFRIFLLTVNFSKVPKQCLLLKSGLKSFMPVCTPGLQILLPVPLLFVYNFSPAEMVLCTFSPTCRLGTCYACVCLCICDLWTQACICESTDTHPPTHAYTNSPLLKTISFYLNSKDFLIQTCRQFLFLYFICRRLAEVSLLK